MGAPTRERGPVAYTIKIDQELCVSSGKCVGDAPGRFRFDDDELAELVSDPEPIDDVRLVAVARNCPGRAIALFDASGSEVPLP